MLARPTAVKPMTGPPRTSDKNRFHRRDRSPQAPVPSRSPPPAAQAFISPKPTPAHLTPTKISPFPAHRSLSPMASPAKRAKASSPTKPPTAPAPEEASAASSEDPVVLLRRRWELASVLNFLRVSLGFLLPLSIRGSHEPIRLFSARAGCDSGSGCLGLRCLSR